MQLFSKIIIFACVYLYCTFNQLCAQENERKHEKKEHKKHHDAEGEMRHFVAFTISGTHVPKARQKDRPDEKVFVPAVGLDYFYRLNHKWEIGGVFDFEFGEYFVLTDHRNARTREVEDGGEQRGLEREYVAVLTAAVAYVILPHWHISLGMGAEVDKHHTIFVTRIGTEYQFNLGKGWVLNPAFSYDFKESYDAWSLTLAIGKSFGKKI